MRQAQGWVRWAGATVACAAVLFAGAATASAADKLAVSEVVFATGDYQANDGGTDPFGTSDPELIEQGARRYFTAHRAVAAAHRSCRPTEVPGTTTTAPVDPALLSTLGLLRTPAAESIPIPPEEEPDYPGAVRHLDALRVVALDAGIRLTVVPAELGPMSRAVSRRCERLQRQAIRRTPAGRARTVALRMVALFARQSRADARETPTPGVLLGLTGEWTSEKGGPTTYGGAVGSATLAELRTEGVVVGLATGTGRSTVVALVPDGVAKVRLTYPRRSNVGWGRTYRAVAHRTMAVTANVGRVVVPRPEPDAWFPRQDWYAADGTHLRTVRPNLGGR